MKYKSVLNYRKHADWIVINLYEVSALAGMLKG